MREQLRVGLMSGAVGLGKAPLLPLEIGCGAAAFFFLFPSPYKLQLIGHGDFRLYHRWQK